MAQFAERLFADRHPWSKMRQVHKLIRLGDRYTAESLDAACERALAVDLIDVNRVKRILVQALEQEAMPQLPLPMPAGRLRPSRLRLRPGCWRPIMTGITELTLLLKRLQLGPMAATLPERNAVSSSGCMAPVSRRPAGWRTSTGRRRLPWTAACWTRFSPWSFWTSTSMSSWWDRQSFLVQALGYSAIRAGHTVRFVHADDFFRAMAQARVDNSLDRAFRSFLTPDLVILDDLGLHRLTAQQSAASLRAHPQPAPILQLHHHQQPGRGRMAQSLRRSHPSAIAHLDRLANAS